MSEENSLLQNIDKVSYATAGVLAVVILALAFLSGGDLAKATADLQTETSDLEDKMGSDSPSSGSQKPARPHREDLEDQWKVSVSSTQSRWLTERAPMIVRKIDVPDPEPASHEPGYVEGIFFDRDSEKMKPYLRIVGKLGASSHVEVTRVELFRREGEGEPTRVSGVALAGDGFEVRDYNIEPGKQYSYLFKTTAKTVDAKLFPLDADAAVQETPELGPTLEIPYDVYISIVTVGEIDGEPVLSGKKAIVDYASGEIVRDKSSKKYREGDKLDKAGRWVIRRINLAGGTEIVIKDTQGGPQIRIGRKRLSVDPIPALEGGPAPTGEGDDDDDDDSAAAAGSAAESTDDKASGAGKDDTAKKKDPKPKKKRRRGRKSF